MKNLKQKYGLVCGVLGAFLVSSGYSFEANCIWLTSNSVMCSYFISIKEKELSIQAFIFLCIAIYGIINLGGYL